MMNEISPRGGTANMLKTLIFRHSRNKEVVYQGEGGPVPLTHSLQEGDLVRSKQGNCGVKYPSIGKCMFGLLYVVNMLLE